MSVKLPSDQPREPLGQNYRGDHSPAVEKSTPCLPNAGTSFVIPAQAWIQPSDLYQKIGGQDYQRRFEAKFAIEAAGSGNLIAQADSSSSSREPVRGMPFRRSSPEQWRSSVDGESIQIGKENVVEVRYVAGENSELEIFCYFKHLGNNKPDYENLVGARYRFHGNVGNAEAEFVYGEDIDLRRNFQLIKLEGDYRGVVLELNGESLAEASLSNVRTDVNEGSSRASVHWEAGRGDEARVKGLNKRAETVFYNASDRETTYRELPKLPTTEALAAKGKGVDASEVRVERGGGSGAERVVEALDKITSRALKPQVEAIPIDFHPEKEMPNYGLPFKRKKVKEPRLVTLKSEEGEVKLRELYFTAGALKELEVFLYLPNERIVKGAIVRNVEEASYRFHGHTGRVDIVKNGGVTYLTLKGKYNGVVLLIESEHTSEAGFPKIREASDPAIRKRVTESIPRPPKPVEFHAETPADWIARGNLAEKNARIQKLVSNDGVAVEQDPKIEPPSRGELAVIYGVAYPASQAHPVQIGQSGKKGTTLTLSSNSESEEVSTDAGRVKSTAEIYSNRDKSIEIRRLTLPGQPQKRLKAEIRFDSGPWQQLRVTKKRYKGLDYFLYYYTRLGGDDRLFLRTGSQNFVELVDPAEKKVFLEGENVEQNRPKDFKGHYGRKFYKAPRYTWQEVEINGAKVWEVRYILRRIQGSKRGVYVYLYFSELAANKENVKNPLEISLIGGSYLVVGYDNGENKLTEVKGKLIPMRLEGGGVETGTFLALDGQMKGALLELKSGQLLDASPENQLALKANKAGADLGFYNANSSPTDGKKNKERADRLTRIEPHLNQVLEADYQPPAQENAIPEARFPKNTEWGSGAASLDPNLFVEGVSIGHFNDEEDSKKLRFKFSIPKPDQVDFTLINARVKKLGEYERRLLPGFWVEASSSDGRYHLRIGIIKIDKKNTSARSYKIGAVYALYPGMKEPVEMVTSVEGGENAGRFFFAKVDSSLENLGYGELYLKAYQVGDDTLEIRQHPENAIPAEVKVEQLSREASAAKQFSDFPPTESQLVIKLDQNTEKPKVEAAGSVVISEGEIMDIEGQLVKTFQYGQKNFVIPVKKCGVDNLQPIKEFGAYQFPGMNEKAKIEWIEVGKALQKGGIRAILALKGAYVGVFYALRYVGKGDKLKWELAELTRPEVASEIESRLLGRGEENLAEKQLREQLQERINSLEGRHSDKLQNNLKVVAAQVASAVSAESQTDYADHFDHLIKMLELVSNGFISHAQKLAFLFCDSFPKREKEPARFALVVRLAKSHEQVLEDGSTSKELQSAWRDGVDIAMSQTASEALLEEVALVFKALTIEERAERAKVLSGWMDAAKKVEKSKCSEDVRTQRHQILLKLGAELRDPETTSPRFNRLQGWVKTMKSGRGGYWRIVQRAMKPKTGEVAFEGATMLFNRDLWRNVSIDAARLILDGMAFYANLEEKAAKAQAKQARAEKLKLRERAAMGTMSGLRGAPIFAGADIGSDLILAGADLAAGNKEKGLSRLSHFSARELMASYAALTAGASLGEGIVGAFKPELLMPLTNEALANMTRNQRLSARFSRFAVGRFNLFCGLLLADLAVHGNMPSGGQMLLTMGNLTAANFATHGMVAGGRYLNNLRSAQRVSAALKAATAPSDIATAPASSGAIPALKRLGFLTLEFVIFKLLADWESRYFQEASNSEIEAIENRVEQLKAEQNYFETLGADVLNGEQLVGFEMESTAMQIGLEEALFSLTQERASELKKRLAIIPKDQPVEWMSPQGLVSVEFIQNEKRVAQVEQRVSQEYDSAISRLTAIVEESQKVMAAHNKFLKKIAESS